VLISSYNFDSRFCCVYSCSERKKSGQVSTCRIGPFTCESPWKPIFCDLNNLRFKCWSCSTIYICIKWMYVCMYVRSGITIFRWTVSFHFPLLPDCISIRTSISREKFGILPKGPKYLRKYVCSRLGVARQRFRNHGHIDGNNWSRRL
jgi:hypothetical protein